MRAHHMARRSSSGRPRTRDSHQCMAHARGACRLALCAGLRAACWRCMRGACPAARALPAASRARVRRLVTRGLAGRAAGAGGGKRRPKGGERGGLLRSACGEPREHSGATAGRGRAAMDDGGEAGPPRRAFIGPSSRPLMPPGPPAPGPLRGSARPPAPARSPSPPPPPPASSAARMHASTSSTASSSGRRPAGAPARGAAGCERCARSGRRERAGAALSAMRLSLLIEPLDAAEMDRHACPIAELLISVVESSESRRCACSPRPTASHACGLGGGARQRECVRRGACHAERHNVQGDGRHDAGEPARR